MIHIEKLGVYLSRPVAFIIVVIYLVQSALLVYLVTDKFDLEKQVSYQQKKIGELEQKLQLYKVIEDFQVGFNQDEVGRLTSVIYSESKKYHYDPLFLVSVILTESTFKKHQISDSGAVGLMQLLPATGRNMAPKVGVTWSDSTLSQPEANIKIGSGYLFQYILRYQDVKKALVAYNVGETKLRGIEEENRPLPKQFLNRVLATYKELKEKYET
jgi:soluble lytic murein transglycosylase